MIYLQNPTTQEVFGYDEHDSSQMPHLYQAQMDGYIDITDAWPPAPKLPSPEEVSNAAIAAIEQRTFLPRPLRDLLLSLPSTDATAKAYIQSVEDEIAALRLTQQE